MFSKLMEIMVIFFKNMKNYKIILLIILIILLAVVVFYFYGKRYHSDLTQPALNSNISTSTNVNDLEKDLPVSSKKLLSTNEKNEFILNNEEEVYIEYFENKEISSSPIPRLILSDKFINEENLDIDSDNDGVLDNDEINKYKTDPNNPDTDGDGYNDGDEIKNGYNPLGEG